MFSASVISIHTAFFTPLNHVSCLFANLLVLVAVPWAMLLSLFAALAGMALGPFAVVVAFPAYALLSYMIGVAQLFAALPFAALSIPAFSAWWLALVYVALFSFVYVQNKKYPQNT